MGQLSSAKYVINTVKQLRQNLGTTLGKHWGHVIPGCFPMMQLLLYIKGRHAAGAGIREAVRKGFLLYLVQSVAFFFNYVPLSAGIHHAAPAVDSQEAKELQEGAHPRNTYCWME